MPRPPVKKTLKLAEAQRTGELRAEAKAHKKKPLMESAKEHIGKILDQTTARAAIDAAIYGSLAYLSYTKLATPSKLIEVDITYTISPGGAK